MIRRSVTKYSTNQEALHQHSFTAIDGIDSSKAPTNASTVLNATNLDVDYDGGLILRKPLVLYQKLPLYIPNPKYMYDGTTLLQIHPAEGVMHPRCSKCVFTDIYGYRFETPELGLPSICTFINYEHIHTLNTATTTLITNVSVDLQQLEDTIAQRYVEKPDFRITLYNHNTEPPVQIRMFKLYKDDYGDWVYEMVTPEITTMDTSNISLDFNTTNHIVSAIRDNYFAEQTSLKGILAYTDNSDFIKREVTAQQTFFIEKSYAELGTSVFRVRTPGDILNRAHFEIDCVELTGYIYITLPKPNAFTKIRVHVNHTSNGQYVNTLVGDSVDGIPTNDMGQVEVFTLNTPLSGQCIITVDYTYNVYGSKLTNATIDILTESNQANIVTYVDDVPRTTVLKAFLDKPHIPGILDEDSLSFFSVGVLWERSADGVTWENIVGEPYTSHDTQIITRQKSSEDSLESSTTWETLKCVLLQLPSYEQRGSIFVNKRADCLIIPATDSTAYDYTYKCTLLKLKQITNSKPEMGDAVRMVDFVMGESVYTFKKGTFETFKNTFKNPLSSEMLYWKHRLCAYGNDLGSNIYVSNSNSAIFPISGIIDLGTYQKNDVTKIIPWRDYLVAFTDKSIHLIQDQEIGFTTKVVNTYVGVNTLDADTCVPILNGIIFKSGTRIYTLVPNYSSGVDTILNITEVSKPIQHLLEKYNVGEKSFAFTTSEYYCLCMPYLGTTVIFKYNYVNKVWTHHILPIRVRHYEILGVNDIRFFDDNGYNSEYYFEKDVMFDNTYGDVLSFDNSIPVPTPIKFSVDSGQKTDNISLTKQFVETKIIVATLDAKDTFNMDVRIDVEGNTFKKHTDLNTDGALLRKTSDDILTLGSNIESTEQSDTFNVMRQMFLRYSGRGKTIRHIISGESLYKFKIYEVFYRYKILNFKQ